MSELRHVRSPVPRWLWLPGLALAFNLTAMVGCAALAGLASSRAETLLAAAGLVFFGLATVAFAKMLRLQASSRVSRDDPA